MIKFGDCNKWKTQCDGLLRKIGHEWKVTQWSCYYKLVLWNEAIYNLNGAAYDEGVNINNMHIALSICMFNMSVLDFIISRRFCTKKGAYDMKSDII